MRQDPLAYLAAELDSLRQQGLYRALRVLDDRQQATAHFDGRAVVNLSSNNYLGLTTHPKLIAAALEIRPHDRWHDGDPYGARASAGSF
jgi:7-keto-8-aminopelargonate synthetase-like enzyme